MHPDTTSHAPLNGCDTSPSSTVARIEQCFVKMRVRNRRTPLSLLLISSLAATTALASALDDSYPAKTGAYQATAISSSSTKPGTKDAPVDGADGRPHEGPFVDVENLRSSSSDLKKDLPPLEGRPRDPTIVDGVKIPETNDGVMNDPNRAEPKLGTTGTSGGVSEKDQVRKAKEGATGEKVENKPEPPKEHPPLPHSEQEKMSKEDSKTDKSKLDGHTSDDGSGFEVCGLWFTIMLCCIHTGKKESTDKGPSEAHWPPREDLRPVHPRPGLGEQESPRRGAQQVYEQDEPIRRRGP